MKIGNLSLEDGNWRNVSNWLNESLAETNASFERFIYAYGYFVHFFPGKPK